MKTGNTTKPEESTGTKQFTEPDIMCIIFTYTISNRIRFRSYFQLQSNAERIAHGFYGVIKAHAWKKIALIVQNENLFTKPMIVLKDLLKKNDVNYTEKVFNTDSGINDLGSNPFDEKSRIFLLSMYSIHARPLLCEAFKRGVYLPKYLLLTIGWYSRFWWRENEPANLSCTADQRESVLLSTLAVTDELFIDEMNYADVTTTPGIAGDQFLAHEKKFLGQPPLNITQFSPYSQICHDATWTLAYALNKTLQSLEDNTVSENVNVSHPFRLEDFSYSGDKVLELIFGHLSNTSFDGLSGKVTFDDQGTRTIYNLIIFQYRHNNRSQHLDITRVGNVHPGSNDIVFVVGEDIDTLWNGSIPYDGVPRKEIMTIHPAITSIYITSAIAGIVFAMTCLIFNFVYRNAKLIKLASAKLNYMIAIGAIILYLNIIFFVVPSTNPDIVRTFCNLTPWLTAIGYSLCYGTILVKMARVYYIFNNPTANKKEIKDKLAMLGVAILITIDLIILVTYALEEGIRDRLVVLQVPNRENLIRIEGKQAIITENCVYICDSTARDIFLGFLYGYKMLLQVIALLLAFSIRKVKVKDLNDAKYIAAAVYVTSIVLVIITVATYTLKDSIINGFSALFCTGFLVGTTVILLLVFVPLMVGLYMDPDGKKIFKNSAIPNDTSIMAESNNKNEVLVLKMRIKELEDEKKESVTAGKDPL